MMADSNTTMQQKVLKCFHCGNETLMDCIGQHQWEHTDEDNGFPCFSYNYTYELFICPVCHNVTLTQKYGDDSMVQPGYYGETEYFFSTTTLYPMSTLDNKAIPKKVSESFEAALKVKKIDNAVCLMALRRTLEFIMCDKGATKWGLKDKIEEIAEKGILPATLKEASGFTKMLGDNAAHGKDSIMDASDVDAMIEFVKYIIEYLYVLPNRIDEYKKKIEEQEKILDE